MTSKDLLDAAKLKDNENYNRLLKHDSEEEGGKDV